MSKLPKYHLPFEGTIYGNVCATFGIYGPILTRHTSSLSAVASIHRYTSIAYRPGHRTLACVESGEWELGELVSIMQTHSRVLRSYLWSLDMPSAAFLKTEGNIRARPVSMVAITDEAIRYCIESLKNEITKTMTVPSIDHGTRPSDAGVLADLDGYVCTQLDSVSIPLMAVAYCNVASKRKTKAENIGYDYIDGRLYFYRRDRLMTEDEVKADQAQRALPPQESSEMADMRRRGASLVASGIVKDS